MLGPGGTKKRPLAKITGAEHNKYDETIRDMEQERAIMAMKIEKLQRATRSSPSRTNLSTSLNLI